MRNIFYVSKKKFEFVKKNFSSNPSIKDSLKSNKYLLFRFFRQMF